jgi:predicted transcriptional regulator
MTKHRQGNAMKTEAFTVRIESKKVKQLDKLAGRLDRSRNYLVNQAIDHLLELNAWQEEKTRTGIQAADEGRFVSDAEMGRIFNKYEDEAS